MSNTPTPPRNRTRNAVAGGVAASAVAVASLLVLDVEDPEEYPTEIRIERVDSREPIALDRADAEDVLGCSPVRVTQTYRGHSNPNVEPTCPLLTRRFGGTRLDSDFRTGMNFRCRGTLTVIARCG